MIDPTQPDTSSGQQPQGITKAGATPVKGTPEHAATGGTSGGFCRVFARGPEPVTRQDRGIEHDGTACLDADGFSAIAGSPGQ
jgi:hypothetical protein